MHNKRQLMATQTLTENMLVMHWKDRACFSFLSSPISPKALKKIASLNIKKLSNNQRPIIKKKKAFKSDLRQPAKIWSLDRKKI